MTDDLTGLCEGVCANEPRICRICHLSTFNRNIEISHAYKLVGANERAARAVRRARFHLSMAVILGLNYHGQRGRVKHCWDNWIKS